MFRVFIDGSAGTTGLRIHDRLQAREDIELLSLPDELRKDPSARKEIINASDIVFLCLPDDAAREAVSMVENPETVVIDTSTAHRTQDGWTYGFPEIGDLRDRIRVSKRVANTGCHASGFISLVAPLIAKGLISPDTALTCFSLTGYSGGGKKMIAQYEAEERSSLLKAPRQYGLTQAHKHIPEMVRYCGLTQTPVFCPIVADFYAGMEVTVPLFRKDLKGSVADIEAVYTDYYRQGLVRFVKGDSEEGFLSAGAFAGWDHMVITVQGNDDRFLLISRFDNLGKGASGAAIQNMNILMGVDESTGLNIPEVEINE